MELKALQSEFSRSAVMRTEFEVDLLPKVRACILIAHGQYTDQTIRKLVSSEYLPGIAPSLANAKVHREAAVVHPVPSCSQKLLATVSVAREFHAKKVLKGGCTNRKECRE